jgi:hypothetical protein
MALDKQIARHSFTGLDTCTLKKIMDVLSKEDLATLNKAFADNVPTVTITHALRAEGYKIGEPTINLHRQGKCRCTLKK